MQQTYVIRPGASFVMPDGTLKAGGEIIALDSDVAATHANSLTLATQAHAETDSMMGGGGFKHPLPIAPGPTTA